MAEPTEITEIKQRLEMERTVFRAKMFELLMDIQHLSDDMAKAIGEVSVVTAYNAISEEFGMKISKIIEDEIKRLKGQQ